MNLKYKMTATVLFCLCSINVFATELINASKKGDTELVIKLVNQGSNINEKSEYGFTPLMFAIRKNDTKLVTYLLKKGADKNIVTKDGHSAFTLINDKTNQSISLMVGLNKNEDLYKNNLIFEIKKKILKKEDINWSDVSKLYSLLEKSRVNVINNLPHVGKK